MWSILAGANSALRIDAVSGQLVQVGPLDFEATPVYQLMVRVVDHGGLTSTAIVTVNVNNVNDVAVTGFAGVTGHSTLGGEQVTLLGANLGPANQAVAATFSVTYGPNLGTTYNATCARVPGAGNTMLLCTTAPGAGGGLRWPLE